MDALQFGRWLGERRRRYGWRSQRSLLDFLHADTQFQVQECTFSEDFLARLEAGQLSHPFRGTVRRRVLLLSRYLAKTQRDVQAYLRAAGLSNLLPEELDELYAIHPALQPPTNNTVPFLLPPRPLRIVGREEFLALLEGIYHTDTHEVCAITGLPGIGKSVLAAESLHRLLASDYQQLFPDGIVSFSVSGLQGQVGLVSLLQRIIARFTTHAVTTADEWMRHTDHLQQSLAPASTEEELTVMIDDVHALLAGKRVLLLLDDVEAHFPLRQALHALQSGSRSVILITSRHVPPAALVTQHLHIAPLEPDAALTLLITLLKRALAGNELVEAQRIVAAVGFLPLAIEAAASAASNGVPLSWLAIQCEQHPFDELLDSDGELRAIFAKAFADFEPALQRQFALLATLGLPSFGLERARASLHTLLVHEQHFALPAYQQRREKHSALLGQRESEQVEPSLVQQMHTAAVLGQFVRHSLIELEVAEQQSQCTQIEQGPRFPRGRMRYHIHPLLVAYGREYLRQLEEDETVNA